MCRLASAASDDALFYQCYPAHPFFVLSGLLLIQLRRCFQVFEKLCRTGHVLCHFANNPFDFSTGSHVLTINPFLSALKIDFDGVSYELNNVQSPANLSAFMRFSGIRMEKSV